MKRHTCYAHECNRMVNEGDFMCAKHWKMLPYGNQLLLISAYFKKGRKLSHNYYDILIASQYVVNEVENGPIAHNV